MAFNSLNFLIFFPLLAIVFYLTPLKIRWLILLAASYFFYINIKPIFALLVAGVTLCTYLFTNLIERTDIENRKKAFMQINIILLLLPLFFFKYFSDINSGIIYILETMHIRLPLPDIKLILPIGISFYTFMAIGYIVDVYNEEVKVEKNIGILALFISFFPLILAGPIERARNMIPQFKEPKKIDHAALVQGLKWMLWGYFLKLVIADRLGTYIDTVYNHVDRHNGTTLMVATLLYPFQMYADFGGYSLIAIGIAKVLGINVIQNFNRPFFATSMSKLWRRWHISLITWLTDYIYTPLAFSFRKYKVWGMVIALMLTFLICGIWHGAALTFIFWGLFQGLILSFETLTNKKRVSLEKKYNLNNKKWFIFGAILITYLLFDISQIFGRANTLEDALSIFSKIFTDHGRLYKGDTAIFYYGILGVLFLMLTEFIAEYFPKIKMINHPNLTIRVFSMLFIIIYIIAFGVFDGSQFIYFQF